MTNLILISLTIFDLLSLNSGREVIKLFFKFNSAEHEIYPAQKCQQLLAI